MTGSRLDSMLSELDGTTEWLNSPPLTAAVLRGHVVAVQFCTYSCVNWIRTLPYVRTWASAYRDDGLVVVGAHAPEFGFEHELDGVHRALRDMRVEHPVVLDNEYAIWRSFGNRYWPALYLLDGDGRLRYRHFGEGAYDETEAAIRELTGAGGDPIRVEADGIELAADWETLGTPETYVGSAQGERRASGS
jgi:thiol-disulfide isomerase/thioredoxin